jgi:alkanesulfonate monooxygenase SsuD/methylene tetrahydromethanopterin reductase-like flavin-dependent oxidoreductase (luciferase family)
MGPKAIKRAAHWADGVYSWSGNGVPKEMEEQQARVVNAWDDAGRDKPPERVAGFWYSLAPNADEKLKAYVYKYIRAIGEAPARAMARNVDRSSQDAVRASLDAYEELGVEECWLNSATAESAEIDGILEVIEKRG